MLGAEVIRVVVESVTLLFRTRCFLQRISSAGCFFLPWLQMRPRWRKCLKKRLDWTIARPPKLTDKPYTGRYRVRDGHLPTSDSQSPVAVGVDPIISGDKSGFSTDNMGSDSGGCVFGCINGYEGTSRGFDLQISFYHGKDRDGPITSVGFSFVPNNDTFIGNRVVDRHEFAPGGTGVSPEFNVHIQDYVLRGFSKEQLQALVKATGSKSDTINFQIWVAAYAELLRREAEERKRKDEENQRCKNDSGCGNPPVK
jgi:hypothetical protein